jgi:hypothetical protein
MSNMNETSIKNTFLNKYGLNDNIINYINDFIYPSRQVWKNEFSKILTIFTKERDTILLKNTDIMSDIIEYEWIDRMPLLVDIDTNEII